MKTKLNKNDKGITLIALVITIIVLLILAGISISMLSGENGILNQATKAKAQTTEITIIEKIKLAATSAITNVNYRIESQESLEEQLIEQFGENGYVITGNIENGWTVTVDGISQFILSNGTVSEPVEKWYYAEDEEGRKTIITNGETELKIGDYINYNATAMDADETKTFEKTYTSPTGTYVSGDSAVIESPERGSGYSSEQEFSNKATTNGWRVLGINEATGEILIISADTVGTTSDSDSNYHLCGFTGYQYGPAELDQACSVFGSGYGATGARSIDVDDINKITGYNPNNIGVYDPEQTGSGKKYASNTMYEYGNEVTYTWRASTANNIKYSGTNGVSFEYASVKGYTSYGFNWYDELTKMWQNSKQDTSNPVDITTLKSSVYWYYPYLLTTNSTVYGTAIGLSKTCAEYLTLFCDSSGNKTYHWLASQYIDCQESGVAYYGIRTISPGGYVSYVSIYASSGSVSSNTASWRIRPVVSLKTGIELQYTETKTDDYNEYNVYDIIG